MLKGSARCPSLDPAGQLDISNGPEAENGRKIACEIANKLQRGRIPKWPVGGAAGHLQATFQPLERGMWNVTPAKRLLS